MSAEVMLFLMAAATLFVVSVIEGLSLINNYRKVKTVLGTIVDIELVAPEAMKIRNSKWATMSYSIDGKEYISKNRIVVPMYSEVGEKRKIKYFIDEPQKLYSKSIKRFLLIFLGAVLFMIIGLYLNTK